MVAYFLFRILEYCFVFTVEDLTNVPLKGSSSCSTMEPLVFSVSEIHSLLENLEVAKSPGPDKIHPLIYLNIVLASWL